MSRRPGLLALLVTTGCAAALGRGAAPPAESGGGWKALVGGDARAAQAAFARSTDPLGLFGRGTLAFERGDTAGAADAHLRVLEAAARRDAWGMRLAPASVARLSTLYPELADREPAERRLAALTRHRLPWRAQVALAELSAEVARRRGDATLLEAEAGRAGCVQRAELVGTAGRRPHLDLEAPLPKVEPGRPLERSACRLTVPAVDGLGGVRVVRAEVPAAGQRRSLVLDYAGPAAARVDGGRFRRHGGADVHGPRWSVVAELPPGKRHTVEVRVGIYGGGADLSLYAVPVAESPRVDGADDAVGAAVTLADAIEADAAGETDRALEAAAVLSGRRRFAAGLIAAARIYTRDATRPANLGRDAARSLLRRAVATDEGLARAWRDLGNLALAEDRPRDAADDAERALKGAPRWWPAALLLADALRARGMERDADAALDRAVAAAGERGGCGAIEAALRRAQDRSLVTDETRLAARLERCDAQADQPRERLRMRGDLPAVERAIRRALTTSADPRWLRLELASARLAQADGPGAARLLEAVVASAPRDPQARLRLADAYVAVGARDRARRAVADALTLFPTRLEVRAAARAFGLPLPTDAHRVDGAALVAAFARSGRKYDAPAVVVLDRTVGRVFADGAQIVLTHNIVRVQTKEGIERWGEIPVPDGAEVLTLRTHKADGTVREPEEIFGKSTISAPDLAAGDYVEWETAEFKEPSEAFAPGFLAERFYFQSVEAPLDRSEYVVVAPAGMRLEHDARAGAPRPVRSTGADGTQTLRFEAQSIPQLFAERAAVSAIEWIPSVRVSSGVTLRTWSRFLADQLHTGTRTSPALRQLARELRGRGGDCAAGARSIVRWVNEHIEPEADVLEPATSTLARGRGNRGALMIALARAAGCRADLVFARSLLAAPPDAPALAQEVDDFTDVLVRFGDAGKGAVYVDPRLRRAAFGYIPPALQGAPAFVAGSQEIERASTSTADRRSVTVNARIDADGEATLEVTEMVTGWPAVEWAEALDRAGEDRPKLRQEFEQQWLSHHFPGATLLDLSIDPVDAAAGGVRLQYKFSSSQLAVRSGTTLKVSPTFFRSQPARRYATEAQRRTTLLLGYDVPLDLEARIELPAGSRVVAVGNGAAITAGPRGEARFAEQRQLDPAATTAPRVIVRRQARLPILRVAPGAYADVAAKLRRVDPVEQAEIRVVLPSANR